jgi:uncharacterized membrane protein (UPF0127 family)
VQTEHRHPVPIQEEIKKKRLPFLAFFLPLLLFVVTTASSQVSDKNFIDLKIKDKKIKVEVVRTEQEKAKGLMFRENLEKDEGMIFVYGREDYLSFWMKNTRIPLSIAFLDKNGKIVDIQDMIPFSLQTHVSAFPARYALEVNQGWFKRNGISVGQGIKLPSQIESLAKDPD